MRERHAALVRAARHGRRHAGATQAASAARAEPARARDVRQNQRERGGAVQRRVASVHFAGFRVRVRVADDPGRARTGPVPARARHASVPRDGRRDRGGAGFSRGVALRAGRARDGVHVGAVHDGAGHRRRARHERELKNARRLQQGQREALQGGV